MYQLVMLVVALVLLSLQLITPSTCTRLPSLALSGQPAAYAGDGWYDIQPALSINTSTDLWLDIVIRNSYCSVGSLGSDCVLDGLLVEI